VVGCFAFAAVVARPLAGRLADERGRRRVMLVGMGISARGRGAPRRPLGVPGLVAARLVLGVGDALLFTAAATWIVDLAPPERRGQAIGLFGLAIWGGLAAGPIFGELLLRLGSYEAVWAFSRSCHWSGRSSRAGCPRRAAPRAPRTPDAARSSRGP
jgi:MFS family permease